MKEGDFMDYKQVLHIDGGCPVSFALPAEGGYREPGLILAPRIEGDTLRYLSLCRDRQSIASLQGGSVTQIPVGNVLGRYPLYAFLCDTVRTFYSDYPQRLNALGVTCCEHLFGQLRWDTVGDMLLLGCCEIGWFLFRRTETEYRYVRAFCGSYDPRYACAPVPFADAMLREGRVERYFIKGDARVVFAVSRKDGQWYLYETDLREMRIDACYPVGECCDVQYMPSVGKYLLFRPGNAYGWSGAGNRQLMWNGTAEICDQRGKSLQAFDFGTGRYHAWSAFAPIARSNRYHVWYTNEAPACSALFVFSRAQGLETTVFENFINVFFNPGTESFLLIQNSGETLQIFRADAALRAFTPVAELRTTALRPRIRLIGETPEGLLLQIGPAVWLVSGGGVSAVAVGAAWEDFEPEKRAGFRRLYLMYGDFHYVMRMYVDAHTGDILLAEPLYGIGLLPKALCGDDGLPDYGRVTAWIRENGIPLRTYTLEEDIDAQNRHRDGAPSPADRDPSSPQNFWVGLMKPIM